MKRLRSLLLPAACFALAWTIMHVVRERTGDGKTAPAIRAIAAPVLSPSPNRANAARALAASFAGTAMSEWSALWEEFAGHATAAELENLPMLASPNRSPYDRSRGRDVLRLLAQEELAMRTGKAAAAPGAIAALAGSDPDAAWEQLKTNNQEELSCAVLRILARRDPADALRRFHALPPGARREFDTGERSTVWHTPLGSLFSAWARRDPAAAAAAAKGNHSNAAGEVAMAWAFKDGAAALRYVVEFMHGDDPAKSFPMDVILRAAFYSTPAESAKLMAEHAGLREAMSHEGPQLRALKPWYDADPQAVVAWLKDGSPKKDSRGAMWLIARVVRADPSAAASLIREFPRAGFPDHVRNVTSIARRDPGLGLSVADELGIRPQVDAALGQEAIRDDPAAACDRWLEALRQHGSDGALAALGWSSEMARELAGMAAFTLPDKARELAALVPASALVTEAARQLSVPKDIERFWPELAPPPAPAQPSTVPVNHFPEDQFALDPAATAGVLLSEPLNDWDAWNAMKLWAPHDFAAARAWLSRVPEGKARELGELALAIEQAPRDPQAALRLLTSLPEDVARLVSSEGAQLWISCLHRLVLTGGDWQGWLARCPSAIQKNAGAGTPSGDLVRTLETEAKLLTLLRKSPGK